MIHATIQYIAQIGPNDWETQTKVLDLSMDTTVREILHWYRRVTMIPDNKHVPMHLQISAEPPTEDQRHD